MAYKRKTRDEYRIEVYYGSLYGWEEVCVEDSRREALARLREYRDNAPEYPARLRVKRVPLEKEG